MQSRTPLLLVAGLFGGSLAAQAQFTQLSPAASPSPRAGMTAVSDGSQMLLFGGKPTTTTETNDLWAFDGTNWTDITPAAGPLPPERDWYGAAYDTVRGRLVLFGGRSTALGANLGDTWEFDGTGWTQMAPAVSPSPRRWCAMTFDVASGACILFGGENSSVYNNETWRWDGANWTQLSPANRPSIRGRGRFSYDVTRAQAVYFGGRNTAAALADTWIWNGSDWSVVATANAPSSAGVAGRFAYGMTYDLARDRHVLIGGTRNGPVLGDVWEFDGSDWTQRSVSGPIGRTGPAVAYSLAAGKTFLFGGFNSTQLGDTWEYQTASFATVAAYGSGCTGPGGALTLGTAAAPWTGDVWSATCTGLGPTSLALEVWGTATTSLPLNAVLPIAPAGCFLWNTAEFLLGPSLPAAGVATVQLAIPAVPSLAGTVLNLQIAEMQLDLIGNWVGLYTSNGLALTLGAR